TSADSVDRIRPEVLGASIRACLALLDVLDTNRTCINLSPYGEPQLGRRGLYRSAGGAVATPADERAMLWVLNQSDGSRSLLDIGPGSIDAHAADLADDSDIAALAEVFRQRGDGIDVLVHSAGTYSCSPVCSAAIEDLDRQYRINVRAPYLLTQALLPALRRS